MGSLVSICFPFSAIRSNLSRTRVCKFAIELFHAALKFGFISPCSLRFCMAIYAILCSNSSEHVSLSSEQFCRAMFRSAIHRSAGLIQDWPGAHLAATSRSKSNSLKGTIKEHLTRSRVFRWSAPPSLYTLSILGCLSFLA